MLIKNRYEIIKPLGSGGFGDTYVAKDTQMPSHRRCVIKQLKPVTNSPQIAQLVQERFQREAAILEELGAHPQIPQLYAYFEDQGNYYLVEESVEGSTLTAQMAQRGTMRESDVREMLTSLLPVLEFVHSKQIVHRDIKPDNIIIRAGDNQPVLIDFGAVKETMGTVVNSVGNATSSIVIGTPGFMPSEQAAGRPIYSSDLYALGLTAIYLLTGKIPQELQTDYHTGEIIWQNQVPLISPTFAAVLDKAIKSHPKERYHTASEMLAALQAPVYQAPPTVPSVPATDGTYVAPSTVVSSPAAGAPTVASTPAPAVATTVSPPAVGGDWQKAAITGTIIGAFILGGFWMTRSQPGPSSNTASNQSTTTTPSATPSPADPVQSYTPPTPSTPSITQEEAIDLINRWLEAKREMFAPPYNYALVEQLTTGSRYSKTIGSIQWLKENNGYYSYNQPSVSSRGNVNLVGNTASIAVNVTEDYTCYINGRIDKDHTTYGPETSAYRFILRWDSNSWKIADVEEI